MTVARTRPDFDFQKPDLAKLAGALPPHAIEAEMCTLGSMIVAGTENVHLIGEVMQIIKSSADFYRPAHAQIYEVLIDLYDKHQSVDITQLFQRIRDLGQHEAIGGVDYLIALAESVPTATNAAYYARIVRDKAKLRQVLSAAEKILHDVHHATDEASKVLDRAEKEIFEVASQNETGEIAELHQLIHETFETLQARERGTVVTGVPTGFYKLDEMLSGLQKGEMIIVAARPSMGKTAFALNLCEYIACHAKQPVAVFSLEMSKQQLAERLLSSYSGVESQKIRRNMLSAEEFKRLADAAQELCEAPMFIDDTPGLSVLELRAKARRLASRHDIKCIMIDYLQLMSYPGAESRVQEVSAISRGVKALARELKVPVICLSQLNRNNEGRESKKPMLSDLRESGSIEQDADVVAMLHREEYYHPDDVWRAENPDKCGIAEVIIAKQRNGPTGTVALAFNGATTRFENLARNVDEGF